MSSRERLTLASAFAVLLAAVALEPVYVDLRWVPRVVGAVALVAGAGLLARRAGVPRALQPPLTLLALAAYVTVLYAGSTLHLLLVPGGDTVRLLRLLFEQGMTDTREMAAPVPSSDGLVLLAVLGVGGTAVLVDTVAVVLDRAAVAGLPLLLMFAVPSAVLPGGLGWLPFTLGAAGWLLLLLVEGGDRLRRWGAPLQGPAQRDPLVDQDPTLGRSGRRIGAAALGLALVVPAVLPGLDSRLSEGSGGGGGGGGAGRSSTTYNPITTLRGQLNLPSPRVLMTYTTTEKNPDYLRMTTLDRFDGRGWSSSPLRGDPAVDGVQDGIPVPEGVFGRAVEVRDRIRIEQLDTAWLPVPFPPTRVTVDGAWTWDRRAQAVFATGATTRELRGPYDVTATRSTPPRGSLTSVGALPAAIAPYAGPVLLTPYVQAEVKRVTGAATTDFAKVEALQQYFLDGARFTYSTSADAKGFGTDDALEGFLRNGDGFCEQFSSAMAAMVRSLGLPARVAVGFTPGVAERNTYTVTTSDAHAWPEVWFAGAGWVRFEPTPRADGATAIPAYAAPATSDADRGQLGTGAAAAPTPTPSTQIGRSRDNDATEPDVSAPVAAPGGRASPAGTPVRGLVALTLLLVLASPAALHAVRRRRRGLVLGPLAAWEQVREDGEDIGHRWAPADSPRRAAAGLARARRLDAAGTAALTRVAAAAELARFARPGAGVPGGGDGLAADVAAVRRALLGGVSAPTRWQARLLPHSTLRVASHAAGGAIADLLDRLDDIIGALAGRLRSRFRPV